VSVATSVVVMVVGGKLLYPPTPHYVMPIRPFKAVAPSGGVIYSARRPVRQIEAGDTVWVSRASNGLPVVPPTRLTPSV
jgi:predicted deacylase